MEVRRGHAAASAFGITLIWMEDVMKRHLTTLSALFLSASVQAAAPSGQNVASEPSPNVTLVQTPTNGPAKSPLPPKKHTQKKLLSLDKISVQPQSPEPSAIANPKAAMDFTLQSTIGRTIRLSDFKGKLVLVNFWASWCPPCRAEMPVLDELAKTYKDAGLVVLGLNVDVDIEARDEFLKDNPVSFLVLDDSKWATAKLYVAPSQPVTFFIDRAGNIAHVHQGYRSGDDAVYAAKVKELLAK